MSGTIKDTIAFIGKPFTDEKTVFANSITIQGTDASKDILSGSASANLAVLSLSQSLENGKGTFTVKNITISDGNNGGVQLGWTDSRAREAINVVMDTVTIKNNAASFGAGVCLQHWANCTMTNCTITENKLKSSSSSSSGGGVVVSDNSTLTLKGATTISENSTKDNDAERNKVMGAGAYVSSGTLIMDDDACIQYHTIDNNIATYGGGVYVTTGGTFTRKNNNGIKKEIKENELTSAISNPFLQTKGKQWYVSDTDYEDDDWEAW